MLWIKGGRTAALVLIFKAFEEVEHALHACEWEEGFQVCASNMVSGLLRQFDDFFTLETVNQSEHSFTKLLHRLFCLEIC